MKIKYFPWLYGKASDGRIKRWRIFVVETDYATTEAKIVTEYGYTHYDNVNEKTKTVYKGKNIGKSNETTPYQQAYLEAESKWRKQIDKGYTEDRSGETEKLLPMLAHPFQKYGKDIVFPCVMQPKLNGVRCLAEKVDGKTIVLHSRQGKEFTGFEALRTRLAQMLQVGEVFDGELYLHGWSFQRIISAVKDPKNPDNEELQYWVYDMPKVAGFENPTFIQRLEAYENKFQKRFDHGCVEYLNTLPVARVNVMFALGESNIHDQHDWWVARGYEGIIIRNHAGLYTFGQRSHDLLKLKNFVDAEFTIIGANEDAEGGVVWVCTTNGDDAFGVRPKGTLEDRQKSLASWESAVGKKLTVRYQNLSEKGVPIFPVGIGVRDYE